MVRQLSSLVDIAFISLPAQSRHCALQRYYFFSNLAVYIVEFNMYL